MNSPGKSLRGFGNKLKRHSRKCTRKRELNDAGSTTTDTDNRANGDLPKLSSLGHYLKGSSATLGFIKLKDECEKIQNYGNMKDATGERDQTDADLALSKIQESVANAEKHYKVVKPLMISYYQKLGVE